MPIVGEEVASTMSTAPLPGTYPAESSHLSLVTSGYDSDRRSADSTADADAPINIVTAPANKFRTGQALGMLGRAVGYLVDSRMFLIDQPSSKADSEALQILKRSSRQVFEERGKLVTPRDRKRLWISGVQAN
jgi:hypothetical protein